MDRQQRQAEGEVRAGEDGEGLDEDVGDGLVAGEVRVELVAAALRSVLAGKRSACMQKYSVLRSDRANMINFSGGGIQSPDLM